jgi:hypothetical protein
MDRLVTDANEDGATVMPPPAEIADIYPQSPEIEKQHK